MNVFGKIVAEWAVLYGFSLFLLYTMPIFAPYYDSPIPGAIFTGLVYIPIRYYTTRLS